MSEGSMVHPWHRVWAATTREEFAALWAELGPFPNDLCAAANALLRDPNTSRCAMCVRPARWVSSRVDGSNGQRGAYCAGMACSNNERVCQRRDCGKLFLKRQDGATGKYCGPNCAPVKLGDSHSNGLAGMVPCVECGNRGQHRDKMGLWPRVCMPCLEPIRLAVHSLRDHKVPWGMARRLLTNPGCEFCGKDILSPEPRNGGGRMRIALVVDHDHSCCPGGKSCGKCVRGFLCSGCNSGIGMLGENTDALRRATDYLDRWRDG